MIKTNSLSSLVRLMAVVVCVTSCAFTSGAQAEDLAVLKGRIAFEKDARQKIEYDKMEVKLRQQVQLPPVPVPKNFEQLKPEAQQKWITDFEASEKGKQFIATRTKLIEDAEVFDVVIEKNGSFVVYDVPSGIFGIQGRLDKEIEGTAYAFEVFGEIEVLEKVDEIPLAPIVVVVTPLLEVDQAAPPISVATYDNKSKLTLDTYKGKYLFLNFWSTLSPDVAFQKEVQKMYTALKEKHELKLLSICIDEKRKAAVKFIVDQQLREGSHGFTDGWDHKTLDNYGVRSIPSFWIIDPQGKIIMTQYDFGPAFHSGKPDLAQIVSDRIEGKDLPTPAVKEEATAGQ